MTENKKWQIRLRGPLGKALERFCISRLAELDYDRLLDPYRFRTGAVCGKDLLLWGQCVSCALQALPYLDGAEALEEKIRRSVTALADLQESCGTLSAFPAHQQLQGLDLPGRRYLLKGLLAAAAVIPDADGRIKECCVRICDEIMALVGRGKRSIIHCGTLGGLDSSACMDVVTGVYRLTREQRFLEFAQYIAGSGCSQQHDIFRALAAGMAPHMLGNGNAVGLTECFKGLAVLGQADPEYKRRSSELCRLYMERIAAEELFITGTGGGVNDAGTLWCRGAFHQTEACCQGGSMGSTDVTAACLEFFEAMTGLTDPIAPFALAERSFYNALLGAWDPERCCWSLTGPTPMDVGERHSAPLGTPLYDLFRGGEALVLAPRMAVRPIENGLVLNLYEEMEASLSRKALVRVTGGYPGSTRAHISIRSRKPFTISMRIPEYCTGVYYCDCLLQWQKNSYLTITRPWEPDEVLTLEFDPRVRGVTAPDDSPFQAFMRGPLVLAVDDRGVMVPEPAAEIRHNNLSWVDFASAGKPADSGKRFRVWFRKLLPKHLYHYFDYD